MPSFKNPNAFSDPEDSELVAKAKQERVEPGEYSYTEVCLPLSRTTKMNENLITTARRDFV